MRTGPVPFFSSSRDHGPRGRAGKPMPWPAAAGAARAMLALTALAAALLGVLYALYPLPMRDLIEREAAACGLDPLFLAAVARRESGFRTRAVSDRGARGLMQVMPETGAWVAERLGLKGYDSDQLFDPAVNLRVGCWYLTYLLQRFEGDPVAALAAYNSGEGTVGAWIEGGQWHPGRGAQAIPYPETRHFVRSVLRDYRLYRLLYRELARLLPAGGFTRVPHGG